MNQLDESIKADEKIEAVEVEEEQQIELDPEKVQVFQAQMEMQQNMLMAIAGGAGAAVIGAAVWAGVTVSTGYQIGWMAIGIGFLVGIMVRFLGKGLTMPYGVIGAVFALVGCLGGNLLSLCGFISIQESVSFIMIVENMLKQPAMIVELLKATFNPMDFVFYAIAVYEGYKFSFRQINQEDIAQLIKDN